MLVVSVARPVALSAPVPSVAGPSKNVTVPVGLPAPGASTVTAAVSVTDWRNGAGLAEAVTVVVPSRPWRSSTVSVGAVLVMKLASPT